MQPLKLQLPKLLVSITKGFKKFYTEKFAGRLIKFLSTEGNAELEMLFTSKIFTLKLSTQMMIILLQFDENYLELDYE